MSQVSVIIPCYKYAHYLREGVESVVSQTGVDVRVLILDDASPDDTPRVAEALAASDSRIAYRRHAANMGHIATYNEGLAWADGDYTVLLSADDLLTPGALRRATRFMDCHPEVGLAYGRAITFSADQPLPQPRSPQEATWKIWNGLNWLETACRTGHVYIRSPEVVVRTHLQHALGGYRAELPHAADIALWMRFAANGPIGQILNADQAYYRVHAQNMHIQQAPGSLADLRERKQAFDALFAEFGDRIPGRVRLLDMLHRRLAREALGAACHALDQGEPLGGPVSELIQYALSTSHEAPATPEYLGLRCRQRVGPGIYAAIRLVRIALVPKWLAVWMGRRLYSRDLT